MPENDDFSVGKCLVQLGWIGTSELIPVRDRNGESIELELGHLRESGAEVEPVAVAVDRRDGRKGAQLDEKILAPDVSTMENVIDFAKNLEHLRPEHAVGIRDDAEPHGALRVVT